VAKLETKKAASARKSRAISLTRAERAEIVKRRLFEAAIAVVGEHGYAGATVTRITTLARVAQGTFYNYYPNRQDLLDQLLPSLGSEMLAFIRSKVENGQPGPELEVARFRAFFDFLLETPQFMRILYEAALYAPAGYEQHMQNVTGNYIRALKRDGLGKRFDDEELEVTTTLLMGARNYLGHAYAYAESGPCKPPEAVFTAYEKIIRNGIYA
jgi:AcrR family transcriptional regulator